MAEDPLSQGGRSNSDPFLPGFPQEPTVLDVADYILRRIGKMSAWKLQKLVYYCQLGRWYGTIGNSSLNPLKRGRMVRSARFSMERTAAVL